LLYFSSIFVSSFKSEFNHKLNFTRKVAEKENSGNFSATTLVGEVPYGVREKSKIKNNKIIY